MNAQTLSSEEVESRVKLVSLETGLEEGQIRKVKLQLDTLRNSGILIDLNIAGTSLLSRQASWLELGVLDPKTIERFTRGRKSMFLDAEKKIKSIEARLRQILDKYAYDINGFRPYRWLNWKSYWSFREEYDRLKEEFEYVKEYEILGRYEEHAAKIRTDFTQIAQSAWNSILGQGYGGAVLNGKEYTNVGSFTDAIVDLALEKMPTREEIATYLNVDYTTAIVYGDQDVAADQLRAAQMQAEIARANVDIRATEEQIRIKNDLLQEQLWVERQKNRAEQRQREIELENLELEKIANQKRREIEMEAIRKAEMEHARQTLQEVGSPFVDVIKQLRNRFAADAETMLESIKKNQYLHGKVAKKGQGLLEFYELMAAHDDNVLRQKLEALKAEIGEVGGDEVPDRDMGKIEDILNEISDLAHANAQELTEISQVAFISI
jgi:hypothetical protein